MSDISAIWLDMQLPSSICGWVAEETGLACVHLAELGMERAPDPAVFERARQSQAVVLTKDRDFAHLSRERGGPPAVIWLRCGNCSTSALRRILTEVLPRSLDLVRSGETLVEVLVVPLDRPKTDEGEDRP